MKFKALILIISLSFATLQAQEPSLAKAGYNSNEANVEALQAIDGAVAFFACVGCHNSKATYSVLMKDGEAFKLKYYSANKSKLSYMKKDFDLDAQDATKLMEILSAEISKAKDISTHTEGAKRGSSFEFAIKNGESWELAGHYSKGAYPLISKIASLLKAKEQGDIPSKIKQIYAEK